MGGTARQFSQIYINYKKTFRKPLNLVATLLDPQVTDDQFVKTFKELYIKMWDDLQKQYDYWHSKNEYIIKKGKKSRYNFRKPYNFILDCSFHIRIKLRKGQIQKKSDDEIQYIKDQILKEQNNRLNSKSIKLSNRLRLIQEVSPSYEKQYISKFFNTYDLHLKLEIMRELSKYKSDEIISFFYKVNRQRNQSLKHESMKYIQNLDLPFVLGRKKEGKKNYIDNEIVKNQSSPEILLKRLYDEELESYKKFDVFFSHISVNKDEVVNLYKKLNKLNLVVYVDWANDKYDLKREWCNASTAAIIKERIKQSNILLVYVTDEIINSQWCPWEIGFADGVGKKICIFNVSTNLILPDYYNNYDTLIVENNAFCVKTSSGLIDIKKWLYE